MKRLYFLTLLLCAASLPLIAGNSIFSYDGYPVQFYGKDIYSLGMGDTGASDIFRNNTGLSNPAIYNLSNRSLFSTGLLMGYNAYKSLDNSGNKHSYLDNSLDLPYFSISVPIKTHHLGFQMNSYASGGVENQREFMLADSTVITEKQEMDRYLYRTDLKYSFNWGRNSIGISGNYYFGHEVRSLTQEADFGLFNTNEEVARSYKNPSFTVGFLRSFNKIAFGATYSMGCTLTGEEVRTSIHEEEDPVDYSYKIPDKVSASVTVLPIPGIKIASDFQYETWNSIDADTYDDAWKLGLGIAYEPFADAKKSTWMRLPVRGGVSYRKLAFKANEQEIDELGLSLGLSLPLKGDVNRIDLGLQYLRRGDLNTNRLQDDSFLLMIGFTGFDILAKASDRTAPREIPEKEDVNPW